MPKKPKFSIHDYKKAEEAFCGSSIPSEPLAGLVEEMTAVIDTHNDTVICLQEILEYLQVHWPCIATKTLVLNAYRQTVGVKYGCIKDYVVMEELKMMLGVMATSSKCEFLFSNIDNPTAEITLMQFREHSLHLLGIEGQEAVQVFNSIDQNGNGDISVNEFALWLCYQRGLGSKHRHNKENVQILKIVHKLKMRAFEHLVNDFRVLSSHDLTEIYEAAKTEQMKKSCTILELYKYLTAKYHCLNHKPAFIAAMKKTLGQHDRVMTLQSKVPRLDLKSFLHNTVICTRINFLFEELDFGHEDHGRSDGIQVDEFLAYAPRVLDISQKEAKELFGQIDRNGGGTINIHEFSRWAFTQKNLCQEEPPAEKREIEGGIVNDDFVVLWEQVIHWMKKENEDELRTLFKGIDDNGNSAITVQEVYDWFFKRYPCLYYKYGIILAFRNASSANDSEHLDYSDWVDWDEFRDLVKQLVITCKIKFIFDTLDRSASKRVSIMDFKDKGPQILKISQIDAINEFKKIDKDGSGKIVFKEFYAWASGKKASFLGLVSKKEKVVDEHHYSKMELSDYDKCDADIKKMNSEEGHTELKGMYDEIKNMRTKKGGDGVATLSKLYEVTYKRWKCLYNKNNVRLAFRAATKKEKVLDYHDLVDYEYFGKLLTYLAIYGRIWWVFDRIDEGGDKNLSFDEFKDGAALYLGFSKKECAKVFKEIDRNGSGSVSFMEFCSWSLPRWTNNQEGHMMKRKISKKKKKTSTKKAEKKKEEEEANQSAAWKAAHDEEVDMLLDRVHEGVAHTELLHTFSISIARLQGRLETTNKTIARFRESNTLLEHEIDHTLEQLKMSHNQLKEKQGLLSQNKLRQGELDEKLSECSSMYTEQKKKTDTHMARQKKFEIENLHLLEHQVELQEALNIDNRHFGKLAKEKGKLEHDRKQLTVVSVEVESRLKLEQEGFLRERINWKDNNLKTMSDLQSAELTVRDAKKKTTELANKAVQFTMVYEEKEEKARRQATHLHQLSNHLQQIRQDTTALRDENNRLSERKSDGNKSNENTKVELEKSKRQLQAMAEKVFTLLEQIDQMECWKREAEQEHLGHFQQNSALTAQHDALMKVIDTMTKKKEKIDTHNKHMSQRVEENKSTVEHFNSKHDTIQAQRNGLEKKLKFRENMLEELASSHNNLSSSCKTEQAQRADQKKLIGQLTHKIKELDFQSAGLNDRVHILETANNKTSKSLKKKMKALERYKQREERYQTIQDELSSGRVSDGPHTLGNDDDEGGHVELLGNRRVSRAFVMAKKRYDNAMRGKQGAVMAKALGNLKLSENTVITWMSDVSKMADGLLGLFSQYQSHAQVHKKAKTTISGNSGPLHSLTTRNNELMQRLQISEDHKTKAVMRLVALLEDPSVAAKASKVAAAKETEGQPSFFLTQDDDQGEDPDPSEDEAEEEEEPPPPLTSLQMSDNGVEDTDMPAIAHTLTHHPSIAEVDLRGNRVSTHGLLTLANTCITNNNMVALVDLQQNNISLDGLEALCYLILSHSAGAERVSDARPATVQITETRGRGMKVLSYDATDGAGYVRSASAPGSNERQVAAIEGGNDGDELVTSACLRRDQHALLPIIEITTGERTMVIDLRYNRLQRTHNNTEKPNSTMMKRSLTLITKLLAATSNTKPYIVNKVSQGWVEYEAWLNGVSPTQTLLSHESEREGEEESTETEDKEAGWTESQRRSKKKGNKKKMRGGEELHPLRPSMPSKQASRLSNPNHPLKMEFKSPIKLIRTESNMMMGANKAGLSPLRHKMSTSASLPVLHKKKI